MKEDTNNKKNNNGLKVFAYSFLTIIAGAALAISILNMSGCTGLSGPKGDQGPQGDKGDTGSKGDTGATGEKGDTGPKGDTGAQGEKGDKGDTGPSGADGSKGDKGDNYYSSTIIPTVGGYVTVNKGSAKENEEITFTIVPSTGYTFISLLFDNESVVDAVSGATESFNYTTNMKTNGFVVQANFALTADLATNYAANAITGELYTGVQAAINAGVTDVRILKDLTENNEIDIVDGKDITIDLNDKTLTMGNNGSANQYIKIDNGKLDVVGKGTIKGSANYIFRVLGAETLTDGQTEYSTLNVDKDVITNCSLYSIAIYSYKDPSTGYVKKTKGVNISYKGTDQSLYFLFVHGNTSNSGTNSYDNVNITVDGATINSISYISGYANCTFKNNTFNIKGSAFNIKSGNLEFKDNVFNITLNSLNRELTPDYVYWGSGAFEMEATLNIFDEKPDNDEYKLGDIKFDSSNKINYTYNNNPVTESGNAFWKDVSIFSIKDDNIDLLKQNINGSLNILTSNECTAKIEGKMRKNASSGWSTIIIYSTDYENIKGYTLDQFKTQYNDAVSGLSSYQFENFKAYKKNESENYEIDWTNELDTSWPRTSV